MKPTRVFLCLFAALLATNVAAVKDPPAQVIDWPESGSAVLRFTLGKFIESGSVGNRHAYLIDTVVENLSSKAIPSGAFSLYLFDKAKIRIGEGVIRLSNVGPGQSVRSQLDVYASGVAVTASIVAETTTPKSVSITLNSIPQGATVKVDGAAVGTTPKIVQVGTGKHTLEFSKEGFNTGHFPLEIGDNDVSGGSVSYELGTAAHDTIELRDGTVLIGDIESMSGVDVVVRVGGAIQHINRNQVKRIAMVQRDPPTP